MTTLRAILLISASLIGSAIARTYVYDYDFPVEDYETTEFPITVSGEPEVLSASNIRLNLNLLHTFIGDLVITIIDPGGNEYYISNSEGGGDDDLLLVDKPLSELGVPATFFANGDWTLKITDQASGDTGTLVSWGLNFIPPPTPTPSPTPLPTPPPTVTPVPPAPDDQSVDFVSSEYSSFDKQVRAIVDPERRLVIAEVLHRRGKKRIIVSDIDKNKAVRSKSLVIDSDAQNFVRQIASGGNRRIVVRKSGVPSKVQVVIYHGKRVFKRLRGLPKSRFQIRSKQQWERGGGDFVSGLTNRKFLSDVREHLGTCSTIAGSASIGPGEVALEVAKRGLSVAGEISGGKMASAAEYANVYLDAGSCLRSLASLNAGGPWVQGVDAACSCGGFGLGLYLAVTNDQKPDVATPSPTSPSQGSFPLGYIKDDYRNINGDAVVDLRDHNGVMVRVQGLSDTVRLVVYYDDSGNEDILDPSYQAGAWEFRYMFPYWFSKTAETGEGTFTPWRKANEHTITEISRSIAVGSLEVEVRTPRGNVIEFKFP